MARLVRILLGPTYQADMLNAELERCGIPAIVRPAPLLAAHLGAWSGAMYSEVLVDEEVLELRRAELDECLSLVGAKLDSATDPNQGGC
jgi:hypothetical protein